MDVVVIVLLVLLGVIVLTKGKPLWSKLKTLLEQLEPLWPFIKETPLFNLLVGFTFMFILAFMLINPVAKKHELDPTDPDSKEAKCPADKHPEKGARRQDK